MADDASLYFKQLRSCLKDKKQDEFDFLSGHAGHMTGHMTHDGSTEVRVHLIDRRRST